MNFPDPMPSLIRQDDGWFPIRWGAVKCESYQQAKGWICPLCSKQLRKPNGRHTFADGDQACSSCAAKWCRSNYVQREPEYPGQLFDTSEKSE